MTVRNSKLKIVNGKLQFAGGSSEGVLEPFGNSRVKAVLRKRYSKLVIWVSGAD